MVGFFSIFDCVCVCVRVLVRIFEYIYIKYTFSFWFRFVCTVYNVLCFVDECIIMYAVSVCAVVVRPYTNLDFCFDSNNTKDKRQKKNNKNTYIL